MLAEMGAETQTQPLRPTVLQGESVPESPEVWLMAVGLVGPSADAGRTVCV